MSPTHSTPTSSIENTQRRLREYSSRLSAAHQTACDQSSGSVVTRTIRIAGARLRLTVVGQQLSRHLLSAFEHLPTEAASDTDAEFLLWDESSSGVSLPTPPWPEPRRVPGVKVTLPAGAESFRYGRSPEGDMFSFFDRESAKAFVWVRDASRLPFYQQASPLLLPIHWWATTQKLRAVHAGCVATTNGAALIAGASGSGKSTTSLRCAQAGLDYLSDDYCLVRAGQVPQAFSIYHNGKLHRNQFSQFPSLAPLAVMPPEGSPDKPIVFLHRHHPERIRLSAPIKVILLPCIVSRPDTRGVPIDASAALRTLAPSSMLQLPQDDGGLFLDLASLARRLPCYRLELGSDLDSIAPVVRQLIDPTL